jgi:hypothetical protein
VFDDQEEDGRTIYEDLYVMETGVMVLVLIIMMIITEILDLKH